MSNKTFLLALALAYPSVGCGTDEVGVDETMSAVENGTPDDGRYPFVCALVGHQGSPTGPLWTQCSGFLVSSRVMVTAKHCKDGQVINNLVDTLVSCDPVIGDTSSFVTGTLIQAPAADAPAPIPNNYAPDVAVVVLDLPIHLRRYARLPHLGAAERIFLGIEQDDADDDDGDDDDDDDARQAGPPALTIVGYGSTVAGQRIGVGTRRVGTMAFDSLDRFYLYALPDPGDARPVDSGAPLFLGTSRRVIASGIGRVFPAITKYFQRADIPEVRGFIRGHLHDHR